jgi:hypothetical protein
LDIENEAIQHHFEETEPQFQFYGYRMRSKEAVRYFGMEAIKSANKAKINLSLCFINQHVMKTYPLLIKKHAMKAY